LIHVFCFKWNSPTYKVRYTAHHVNVVRDMVLRNYDGPIRFVCITDGPQGVEGETFPLWGDCAELVNASGQHLPSCYRRLKLFDPETQAALGVNSGDRLVSLDLDTVITGNLNSLWDRSDSFVGWALPGTYHPRVFNGSMWLLQAGAEANVWRKFDPNTSPAEARAAKYLGSDQSWMSYQLQGRAGWGETDGVFSYPNRFRGAQETPPQARIIMFHGFQKPWDCTQRWVRDHFRLTGRGTCLILGYGPSLWDDVARALESGDRFDGVIASPEAAEHWPEKVTAIAKSDVEAERLAFLHGFDNTVFCGRQEMEAA
jgi:hypothetical protein